MSISILVAVVISAVFLAASAAKVTAPAVHLSGTLEALGLPPRVALGLASAAPWVEMGVAVALVLAPAPVTAAILVGAGIVIGGAGWLSLRRSTQVFCHCFSATSSHPLGARQIVLGLVLVLAAVATLLLPPESPFVDRAAALSVAAVVAGVAMAVHVVRVGRELAHLRAFEIGVGR